MKPGRSRRSTVTRGGRQRPRAAGRKGPGRAGPGWVAGRAFSRRHGAPPAAGRGRRGLQGALRWRRGAGRGRPYGGAGAPPVPRCAPAAGCCRRGPEHGPSPSPAAASAPRLLLFLLCLLLLLCFPPLSAAARHAGFPVPRGVPRRDRREYSAGGDRPGRGHRARCPRRGRLGAGVPPRLSGLCSAAAAGRPACSVQRASGLSRPRAGAATGGLLGRDSGPCAAASGRVPPVRGRSRAGGAGAAAARPVPEHRYRCLCQGNPGLRPGCSRVSRGTNSLFIYDSTSVA